VTEQFSLGGCVSFTPRIVTGMEEIAHELLWECSVCQRTGTQDLLNPIRMTRLQAAAHVQHQHGKGKGGCTP
jgi:hypothetical protein